MTRSSPSAETAGSRRTRRIVRIAAAVYALTLALAWVGGDVWQSGKSEDLLRTAHETFASYLEEDLHSVQWFQANLVFDAIGWTNAAPRSVAEMRALAERFYIDELNIVSTNGVVIASNLPKVVGDDWWRHPQTAAFLEMFSPTSSVARMAIPRMAQPFRHGTVNPDYYCAYFAEAFLDRSGLLQLGYRMDRLVAVMSYSDCKNIREWEFGRHGHFTAIDADGDRTPDPIPAGADEGALTRGVFDRVTEEGEGAARLTFAYAGHLFAAIVPDREFGEQRLWGFVVFAATSAVLIFLFTLVLVRLSHAARKVAALHREAGERASADLAVARTIQLSSLPNVARYRKALFTASLAAEMRPAREVGGDFYDCYFTDATHLAFVVADVSGKGFAAAMFMMRAKNELFNALCADHELDQAVARANARICEHNEAEMLVTAWVGVLDVRSGELEYVNAGHNRPFLRRADGTVEKVTGRGGLLFGVRPDAGYRLDRLALRPGDLLFVYTDGVTEAMNRDRAVYGEERLQAALKGCGTDPDGVISAVGASVGAFVAGAEQSDDLTAFALVWHGIPEPHRLSLSAKADALASAMAWLDREIGLEDRTSRMRLLNAADEIMANIVRYSGAAEFSLTVENAPARTCLTFADSGREYNPLSHADPNTHAALEERPEGGLGILMTKRLVDAVNYQRSDGRNVLALVKLDRDS